MKITVRRAAILVVVVLVVLVLLVLKSFSSSVEFTDDPVTSQGAPAGTEQLSGEPNIDIPRDLSRMGGSVNDTKWAHFVSDDSPEEVIAAFAADLAEEGFDSGRELESGAMLYITAFERVGVYAVEVDGKTTVITFRGHE